MISFRSKVIIICILTCLIFNSLSAQYNRFYPSKISLAMGARFPDQTHYNSPLLNLENVTESMPVMTWTQVFKGGITTRLQYRYCIMTYKQIPKDELIADKNFVRRPDLNDPVYNAKLNTHETGIFGGYHFQFRPFVINPYAGVSFRFSGKGHGEPEFIYDDTTSSNIMIMHATARHKFSLIPEIGVDMYLQTKTGIGLYLELGLGMNNPLYDFVINREYGFGEKLTDEFTVDKMFFVPQLKAGIFFGLSRNKKGEQNL